MNKFTKLLTLTIALCFFVLPANALAYDPLYATAADSIFEDNSWTGFEEVELEGALFAYHVWYDVEDVQADYYYAWYDTYTYEYLLYHDETADAEFYESWGYRADYGGTYESARERQNYIDDYKWLYYETIDNGYDYYYEYDYEDDIYSYWVEIETSESGYYYYWYDYESYATGLEWEYMLDNDIYSADYSEYSYLSDPANGVFSSYYNWESTETGSYFSYSEDSTGTYDEEWEYDSRTYSGESYSDDYSSYYSSYAAITYSEEGEEETIYFEYNTEIYDTDYYSTGYFWYDQTTEYYESYYEGISDYYYYYSGCCSYEADSYYEYYYAGVEESWEYAYGYQSNLTTEEYYYLEYTEDYENEWSLFSGNYYEKGRTFDGYYYEYDTEGYYYEDSYFTYSSANGDWWNYSGTESRTYNEGWGDWEYDTDIFSFESYDAEYSSYYSSYISGTLSEEGESWYYEWSYENDCTDYYENGYYYYDEITEYFEYYEEGIENYYEYAGCCDYYADSYYQYYEEGVEESYYYEYEYQESLTTEEYYSYEYSEDYENGWYVWYIDYYELGETVDGYYYEYDTGDYYYEDSYFTFSSANGDWLNYSGTESRYYQGEEDYDYGSGFRESTFSSYTAEFQRSSYSYDYETYVKGEYNRETYDYYYSEYALADSDESSVYWRTYTYDSEGVSLTYEEYSYFLNTDTGFEGYEYQYSDYTGEADTYYYDEYYENLYTGEYDYSETYVVSGQYLENTWYGQDSDWYWYGTSYANYIDDYSTSTYYDLSLITGTQFYEQTFWDDSTNDWTYTELYYFEDAWTGYMVTYDDSEIIYDLYNYTNYPGDYILLEDVDPYWMN